MQGCVSASTVLRGGLEYKYNLRYTLGGLEGKVYTEALGLCFQSSKTRTRRKEKKSERVNLAFEFLINNISLSLFLSTPTFLSRTSWLINPSIHHALSLAEQADALSNQVDLS